MPTPTELPQIIDFGINLADAVDPELLPPGEYPAEVVKSSVVAKKNVPGKFNFEVTFCIHPDAYPVDFDVENAPDGVLVTTWRSGDQTKSARAEMRKLLTALNMPLSQTVDANELIGNWATVVIKHKPWEDKMQLAIAAIKSV